MVLSKDNVCLPGCHVHELSGLDIFQGGHIIWRAANGQNSMRQSKGQMAGGGEDLKTLYGCGNT